MCETCWQEYGSPRIVNDRTLEVARLANKLYDEESGVGGKLHIVLDDWNIEDEHVRWCATQVETDLEKKISNLLVSMSKVERASALALADGFYDPL